MSRPPRARADAAAATDANHHTDSQVILAPSEIVDSETGTVGIEFNAVDEDRAEIGDPALGNPCSTDTKISANLVIHVFIDAVLEFFPCICRTVHRFSI